MIRLDANKSNDVRWRYSFREAHSCIMLVAATRMCGVGSEGGNSKGARRSVRSIAVVRMRMPYAPRWCA